MSSDVLMLSVSGCRGIIGTSLTPDVAARFAAAFAAWLGARPRKSKGPVTIVLARDGRRGSDLFASVVRAALLGLGADVLDLDIAMTPTVGVMVDENNADGGLMITASHNPQQWCGLKPIIGYPGKGGASAPSKGDADAIIKLFHQTAAQTFSSWQQLGYSEGEGLSAYTHSQYVVEALSGPTVKTLAKFQAKLVTDHLGMAGSEVALGLKGGIHGLGMIAPGCTRHELYPNSNCARDPRKRGLFPHTPEPLKENLTALAKAVRKHKAHVGFAQDPDADRLAIIDEKGNYIGEEYTLVLCAMALGELGRIKKNDKLVINLSTSRMIEDIAARYGAKVLRSAVGEANVVEMMKKNKAVLGGEGNGGVIWPKVTYIRDSLSAMALVLVLMQRTKKSISQLVADIPAYAIVKRKVDLPSREAATGAAAKLAEAYKHEKLDHTDGVRIEFASQRAWLHVRASNTEPIMRLIAEAPTRTVAEKILDDAARVIG